MPLPASSPSNKRVVVPEFPQFKSVDGSVKLPPRISVVCPSSNILIPQCTKQSRVETTSFPSDKLEILRKENISIFSGNVYAYEEGLEIWSEKLTVTSSDDERTINKIDALDNVKILRQNLMINGRQK